MAVCAVLACVLALPAAQPAAAATKARAASFHLAVKIYKARQKHGLRPLRISRSLRRSSRRYACRMLARDYFGHLARVAAPRKFKRRGEALGMTSGYRVRWKSAWRGWIRSSSHRRLILSPRFRWLGLASCRGRMGSRRATTWVIHLGKL